MKQWFLAKKAPLGECFLYTSDAFNIECFGRGTKIQHEASLAWFKELESLGWGPGKIYSAALFIVAVGTAQITVLGKRKIALRPVGTLSSNTSSALWK